MDSDPRASFEQCRRRYPTVDVPFEDYLARVQQVQAFASGLDLHYGDLYLALACSRGDRIAWEHFADEYLPLLRRWAAQACRNLADGDDLSQDIVQRLLDHRQKFGAYDGRGSLASWLRVVVSRAAVDHFRKGRHQVSLQAIQEEEGGVAEPVEVPATDDRLDARWGVVIVEQVSKELDRLPARDRLLLGLYYVEEVSLKAIARHFGVHESTASRWLEGVRNGLRRRVEREARARFGLRSREVRTLWKDVADVDGFLRRAVRVQSSQAAETGKGDK